MDFEGEKYIAHCNTTFGEREYLGKLIEKGGNNLILIGPEGDFSTNELKGELKSVKKSQAIYKDYESKINLEENNVTGF